MFTLSQLRLVMSISVLRRESDLEWAYRIIDCESESKDFADYTSTEIIFH